MAEKSVTPFKTLHDEKQEATRLGFSVRTLQQWRVRGGGPPYVKLGKQQGAVRYDPVAVDAWLEAHTRTNTSGEAA